MSVQSVKRTSRSAVGGADDDVMLSRNMLTFAFVCTMLCTKACTCTHAGVFTHLHTLGRATHVRLQISHYFIIQNAFLSF